MKYVPIGECGVYTAMKNIDDGNLIPKSWHNIGRPPLATEDQIVEFTSTLIDRPGISLGKEDVARYFAPYCFCRNLRIF